jgi:6-phosphofructo-2-kinase/fructose-2,6-biphosphatase 4
MLALLFGFSQLGEKSPETKILRKKTSDGCERLIWDFFEQGGQVVIYDANNGTRAARQTLAEKFDAAGIHVVMLGMAFCSLLTCTDDPF